MPLCHDELWKNRVELDILDTTVNHLGARDLLLMLVMNSTKEQWNRIERVCQIAELIRREPDMPWDRVRETARRTGLRRSLDLTLCLAFQLLRAPIPDESHRSIARDRTVEKLATGVVARYLRPPEDFGSFDYSGFVLAVRERFRDRYRYVLHRLRNLTAPATDSTQEAVFRWRDLPRRVLRLPQLAWRYGIRGPVVAFFGRAPA